MEKSLIYEVKGLLPESVVISLEKQLKISADIDGEVDRGAHTFGFYAVLAEKARTRYQKMKFAFEAKLADWESIIAKEREYSKMKPLSEAKMKVEVRTRFKGKFQAFQLKLIEYEEQRRILEVIAKAFEMKASLIQTKSANRRKEG